MRGLIGILCGLIAWECLAQVYPELEWASIQLKTNDQVELRFHGQPERSYIIEASRDLIHWSPVSESMTATRTMITWTDSETSEALRFYRVVLFDRDYQKSQFEESRLLWNEKGLTHYTYQFNWSCFCLPDYIAPVDIRVEQGEWISILQSESGSPVAREDWDRYESIEGLFEILKDAFDQDASHIHAEYHPEYGYPTSVFIDYSKQIADEERGFNVRLTLEPAVQFKAVDVESLQVDSFRLLSAEVRGDMLQIEVEYGGGCREHEWSLCADPNAFMESQPVQINLYLSHEGNNDLCKALVRDTRVFSLQALKERFQEIYPDDEILILNVHGFHLSEQPTILSTQYQMIP